MILARHSVVLLEELVLPTFEGDVCLVSFQEGDREWLIVLRPGNILHYAPAPVTRDGFEQTAL